MDYPVIDQLFYNVETEEEECQFQKKASSLILGKNSSMQNGLKTKRKRRTPARQAGLLGKSKKNGTLGEKISIVGIVISTISIVYVAFTYSEAQDAKRKEDLLLIYTKLTPQISIENFEYEAGGSSIARLSYEVENFGASTVRILALPPRMYNCNGELITFAFSDNTWQVIPIGGEAEIKEAQQHPRNSASILPFAKDIGSITITSLGGAKISDIRKTSFQKVVIVEFKFMAFSDLSWKFAKEVEAISEYDDQVPYYASDPQILELVNPMPPVRTIFRVPRRLMFVDGNAEVAPKDVCESGISKVLGKTR